MFNRKLTLNGEDFGAACKKINGKEEYEYHVSLDEDNTMRLLVQLRMKYGVEVKLESIFNEEFGQKMPSCKLMDFCKEKSIQYDFTSY